MSDLDLLGRTPPESLRFNALTGVLALNHFDAERWQRAPIVIEPPSKWAVDFATRMIGYGRVSDSVFDMRLVPVGQPVPALSPDEEPFFKTAFSMLLYNPEYGFAQMTSASAVLGRAICNGLWERIKGYAQAAEGLIPITVWGEPREVAIGQRNPRTFWAPSIGIAGWVDRNSIAAFAARPALVEPPLASDRQIRWTPMKPLKGPAKKGEVADDLDDGLPENL
jgi:hypothetical protein